MVVEPILSYDVASGSDITPCNKIDKPLVVYHYAMMLLTSRIWQNPNVFTPKIRFQNKFYVIHVRIIESNTHAHVLLNLLNSLRKRNKL